MGPSGVSCESVSPIDPGSPSLLEQLSIQPPSNSLTLSRPKEGSWAPATRFPLTAPPTRGTEGQGPSRGDGQP